MRPVAAISGLLFIALCQSSLAQTDPEASAAPPPAAPPAAADDLYAFDLGKPMVLNCTPSSNVPVDTTGVEFAWLVNGSELSASAQLKERAKLSEGGARLTVDRVQEDDFGNYSCSSDGSPAFSFSVRTNPQLRMQKNYNVVEGQKIKLTCRVFGKPYPAVTWRYRRMDSANYSADAEDAMARLGERATLETSAAGVPGGDLVLLAARAEDAGLYSCATPGFDQPDKLEKESETALRVKDMYAALWPFLGICAEVFVLCAIILVYEKRRTKPECEDSDTDNHEQ